MKKTLLSIFYIIFFANSAFSENKINPIYEGSLDAKIQLIIYESLTCSHCADFHKNVYPDLKENFIDKGYVKIEFRNFPLDLAALNASKIAHCKNDGKSDILHFLFENQEQWLKGNKIEDINSNLKKILDTKKYGLNIDKCINNKKVEDHILEDRINAVKKFKLNSTPTLIINNKKFDKPLKYKNLKKILEKLI
ncbi:MAG: thioredoxin domain-containing protein [Pelagibacterales bacterium]|nr:thioredoxin domain-containing protein [Pelagibacterales bacterium]